MNLPALNPLVCARLSAALLHSLWEGPLIFLLVTGIKRALSPSSSSCRYAALLLAQGMLVLSLPINFLLADHLPAISFISGNAAVTDPGSQPPAGRETTALPNIAGYRRLVASGKYASAIVLAYLIGAALMLVRLAHGLFSGQRLLAGAKPIDQTRVLATLARAAGRMNFSHLPACAYCSQVLIPCVVGVMRPMLLLPFSVTMGLIPQELELLIMHELAHIRRYDPVINLVQRSLEVFVFYHPVSWILSRQIRLQRELCCDDRVIAAGCSPREYALSLIHMAEIGAADRMSPVTLVPLAATGDISQLRQRVARLLNQPTDQGVPLKRIAAGVLTLAVLALLTIPMSISMSVGAASLEQTARERLAQLLSINPQADTHVPGAAWSRLHLSAAYGTADEVRFLLAAGADPNSRQQSGWTPLHTAVAANRLAVIEQLVQSHAHINAVNMSGTTALQLAAESKFGDSAAIVELLCRLGADVDLADHRGRTPLFLAAAYGNTAAAEILLDHDANIEGRTQGGATALLEACDVADPAMVALLIARGADVSAVDYRGGNALDALLLRTTKPPDAARIALCATQLLQRGVEPGFNASIVLGMKDRVMSMLRQDPSLANGNGLHTNKDRRPLHWAASVGDLETCRAFLDCGADVNALTSFGRTALHLAAGQDQPSIELLKLLRDHHAKMDVQDNDGQTPLLMAMEHPSDEAVEFLISAGARVNITDRHGTTALHMAAVGGRSRLVDLLLDSGANPNAADMQGLTPLHLAASHLGWSDITCRLIDHGADRSIRDHSGKTADQLAQELTVQPDLKTSPQSPAAWN